MKLIYASTILIGAAAKKPRSPNKKSPAAARLRGPQEQAAKNKKEQRELQLFDGSGLEEMFEGSGLEDMFGDGGFEDMFGGGGGLQEQMFGGGDGSDLPGPGGDLFGCNKDTCSDDKVCNSMMMMGFGDSMMMMGFGDPATVFKDACNAGCIPNTKLSTCEQLKCNSDEEEDAATTEAASTAIARMGLSDMFFGDTDAAVELMCSDCKFYTCCVSDPSYETCKVHLVDNMEEQALGNSVLDEFATSLSDILEGITDNLVDAFEGMDLDITNALDAVMGEDSDGGDLESILTQVVDSFSQALDGFTLEEMDMPEWNFTITDWGDGAVWSGIEMASGVSVFGQVAGSFVCPKTCTEEDLCDSIFTGMADPEVLEKACNSGCLPSPESCDDVCGNADGQGVMAPTAVERFINFEAVTNMACDSCKFLTCCGITESDSVTAKFDSCQDILPDVNDLWSDIANSDWEGGIQEWVDSVDWSGMAEELGLSELFGDLQSLFDDTLAEFESFPVTCNTDTCPITGFCEMNIDLASMDLGEVCSESAFFECGEGLEKMCTDMCGDGSDGFAPLCSLCTIATCCSTSKEDGKSFEDCAVGALPEVLTLDDLSDSASSTPAEDTLPDSNGSPAETLTEETPPEPSNPVTPDEDTLSSGNSAGTPVGGSLSEPVDSPIVPVESASAESTFEISRASVQDSASYTPGTSTICITLASVATLFFASF